MFAKQQAVGLDIHDDRLTALVLDCKGKDTSISDCISVHLPSEEELPEKLAELAGKLGKNTGRIYCGLSLSECSFRNLSLPFVDRKKIDQVLPFELEEEMLVPVHQQVISSDITSSSDTTSQLLIAGIEKTHLENILDTMQGAGIDPVMLLPTVYAFAETVTTGAKEDAVFLDTGKNGISMALLKGDRVVFLRHVPYTDSVFTTQPFRFFEDGLQVQDEREARECITALCRTISASIHYFYLDTGVSIAPAQVVISGQLAEYSDLSEIIHAELELETRIVNLVASKSIAIAKNGLEFNPTLHNRALALALCCSAKKHAFNFRREEFAHSGSLLQTGGRVLAAAACVICLLAAIAGFQWWNVRQLQSEYDRGSLQVKNLFSKTFPDVQRIVDPYAQMKAKMQEAAASPAAILPAFTGEKRTLEILADISGRIPETVKIHVSRMVLDQESVRLRGTTDAYNNVDVIKNRLAASPRFREVDIISATADRDKNGIRFELRLLLGGS